MVAGLDKMLVTLVRDEKRCGEEIRNSGKILRTSAVVFVAAERAYDYVDAAMCNYVREEINVSSQLTLLARQ